METKKIKVVDDVDTFDKTKINKVLIENIINSVNIFNIKSMSLKEIMMGKSVDPVYYRFEWNRHLATSKFCISDRKDLLVMTNYHKPEFVDIIENINQSKPNSYMLCTSYSSSINAKTYADTQVGVSGTGNSASDIVREFEEEIGITIDVKNVKEISKGKWSYYTCDPKDMILGKKFAPIMQTSQDNLNKYNKNKCFGFVVGTYEELMNIFQNETIINRRPAKDIKYIHGFDLINVEFMLNCIKMYYKGDVVHGRSKIVFD